MVSTTTSGTIPLRNEPKPKAISFIVGVHLGRGLEKSALAIVERTQGEDKIRCLAARSLTPPVDALDIADELAEIENKLQEQALREITFLIDCQPIEREKIQKKLKSRSVISCNLTTDSEEVLDQPGGTWKINGIKARLNVELTYEGNNLALPENYKETEIEEMFAQLSAFNPTPSRRKEPDTIEKIGSQNHLAIAMGLACHGAKEWPWPEELWVG